ncbi:hypothetical protein K4K52_000214 [Colletotrichum sp. SAR 10_76]|nr:hypothetical protein K4K52_000214 [Colletotrichum sp. SAR 10_76]
MIRKLTGTGADPDTTRSTDSNYICFDDRSDDRNLLSMNQGDVESFFSAIPPESAERLFTELEPVCGHLEKPKRRKVWSTIQHFFVESAQQIMGGKTTSKTNRDAVHPHEPSTASVSSGTTAPESGEQFAEAEWSTTQNHAKDSGQPVLETTPAMSDVKNLQTTSLQDHLEFQLSQFPNENAFTQLQPQNTEIAVMDSENPLNKCTNAERPVSILSGNIMGDTYALDAFVPSEDLSSLYELFDFESILNGPEEKHVDSASVDWLTEHANL